MSAAKRPFDFSFPLPSEGGESGKETTGKAWIKLLDPIKYTPEEIRNHQREVRTRPRWAWFTLELGSSNPYRWCHSSEMFSLLKFANTYKKRENNRRKRSLCTYHPVSAVSNARPLLLHYFLPYFFFPEIVESNSQVHYFTLKYLSLIGKD